MSYCCSFVLNGVKDNNNIALISSRAVVKVNKSGREIRSDLWYHM